MSISRKEILACLSIIPVGRTFAIVDKKDASIARRHKWTLHVRGNDTYAAKVLGPDGKLIWLHHLIAEAEHGPKPPGNYVCDAENGDALDCRRENVSWAVRGETAFYRRKAAVQSGA